MKMLLKWIFFLRITDIATHKCSIYGWALVSLDPLNLHQEIQKEFSGFSFQNEISVFEGKNHKLFNLINNFEYMIMKTNYDKLNIGWIIPGWAAMQVETLSKQGARALICRSDIVGVDNESKLRDWRKKDAKNLGYKDSELIKETGLGNISINQIRKVSTNDELNFLFELGLKVPSDITVSDLITFKSEKCSIELRNEFLKFLQMNPDKRKKHIIRLHEKITKFNSESQENFQTKTLFFSGLISTFGGIVGGTPGSILSGIGASIGVYYVTKHNARRKWMGHLKKYVM